MLSPRTNQPRMAMEPIASPNVLSESNAARAMAQNNREIATELVLSEKTVERHLSHIFTKLQVSSRAAAVRLAVQAGIA